MYVAKLVPAQHGLLATWPAPGVAFGGVVRRMLAKKEPKPEKDNDLWFWEGKVRRVEV